jgi:4-hydroxybenzoate polyprenyltransferase
MGGFLINAFYDFEKDMINQPSKTYFGRLVSKKTCLNIYVLLNIIGLLTGLLISKEIFIFNLLLTFSLWIYSPKIKR